MVTTAETRVRDSDDRMPIRRWSCTQRFYTFDRATDADLVLTPADIASFQSFVH